MRWDWGVFSGASRPVLHSFVQHHLLNNYTWEGQVMGRIHAITAPRQNTHLSLLRWAALIGVIGGSVGWRLGVFGWLSCWSLWQRSRQGRTSATVLTDCRSAVAGNHTVKQEGITTTRQSYCACSQTESHVPLFYYRNQCFRAFTAPLNFLFFLF